MSERAIGTGARRRKRIGSGRVMGRCLVDFFMRQKRRGLCYARKLLIAMTFARRNALLALDNLIIFAAELELMLALLSGDRRDLFAWDSRRSKEVERLCDRWVIVCAVVICNVIVGVNFCQ